MFVGHFFVIIIIRKNSIHSEGRNLFHGKRRPFSMAVLLTKLQQKHVFFAVHSITTTTIVQKELAWCVHSVLDVFLSNIFPSILLFGLIKIKDQFWKKTCAAYSFMPENGRNNSQVRSFLDPADKEEPFKEGLKFWISSFFPPPCSFPFFLLLLNSGMSLPHPFCAFFYFVRLPPLGIYKRHSSGTNLQETLIILTLWHMLILLSSNAYAI